MCVGLYDRNQHCVEHYYYRSCNLIFYIEFLSDHAICKLTYICSDVVRVSVVLGVASQLPKMLRNDRGSTGKHKNI